MWWFSTSPTHNLESFESEGKSSTYETPMSFFDASPTPSLHLYQRSAGRHIPSPQGASLTCMYNFYNIDFKRFSGLYSAIVLGHDRVVVLRLG